MHIMGYYVTWFPPILWYTGGDVFSVQVLLEHESPICPIGYLEKGLVSALNKPAGKEKKGKRKSMRNALLCKPAGWWKNEWKCDRVKYKY